MSAWLFYTYSPDLLYLQPGSSIPTARIFFTYNPDLLYLQPRFSIPTAQIFYSYSPDILYIQNIGPLETVQFTQHVFVNISQVWSAEYDIEFRKQVFTQTDGIKIKTVCVTASLYSLRSLAAFLFFKINEAYGKKSFYYFLMVIKIIYFTICSINN